MASPVPPPPPIMDPVVKNTLEGQIQILKIEKAKLDKELKEAKPSDVKIEAMIYSLRKRREDLAAAHEKALAFLVKNDMAGYVDELERQADIREEMGLLEVNAQRVLIKIAGENIVNPDPAPSSSYHRVNLPQRKLQHFSGDVREWLGFWSSFEDIHLDNGLSENDKFQYLLECIPKNSAARKVIDGYTVSAKNYTAVIDTLQNLYGRSRMLVKVFVRDLLQLVINNATKGSSVDFLDLYPKLSSYIRNLEELQVTSDKCEEVLYPLVESCLPEDILLAWQRNSSYEEKLEKIMDFLKNEVNNKMDRSLAKMEFTNAAVVDKKQKVNKEKQADPPAAVAFMNANAQDKKKFSCAFCGDTRHETQECGKAKAEMTMEQKMAVLKEKKCCFRCLRTGHFTPKCRKFVRCCICGGRHFEVICSGKKDKQEDNKNSMLAARYDAGNMGGYGQQQGFLPPPQPQQKSQVQANGPPGLWSFNGSGVSGNKDVKPHFTNTGGDKKITLSTLLVVLETPTRSWKVRVFLDSGAEVSYITKEVAIGAGLPMVGERRFRHQRFGGDITEKIRHPKYQVTLSSLDGRNRGSFVLHAIDKIAHYIGKPKYGPYASQLARNGIYFHDQGEADGDIHIMFGMDVLAQIWSGGFHRISPFLYAAETVFGWVVGGEEPGMQDDIITTSNMVTMMMVNEHTVEDLWALEAMGIREDSNSESKEDLENAVIEQFERTVERNDDGRYVVHLPWKDGHKKLNSNFHSCLFRLKKMTADLKRQGYLEAYNRIFSEWEADGVIKEVPGVEESELEEMYLMPHRHVIKQSSSTTPVRPVFDASAKGKGGPSLNDCLAVGPNLLELIPAIMCRFRKCPVGAVSDIKKAFLQIEVAKEDQEFLQFLWWADSTCQKLKLYRHQRVVFGVKPSPFLLAATLSHHVKKTCADNPRFAKKLLDSLYVDNSCSSHSSIEEAMEFKEEAQQVLLPAKFDLRGWELSKQEEDKVVAVLGMMWATKADDISFCLDSVQQKVGGTNTKRSLLSILNSLFDPMGFLCAFTVIPKLLLQDCCKLKLGWDDDLPEDIAVKLAKWKSQVPVVTRIKIPRWLGFSEDNSYVTVHTFCDASGFAFATTIFLRVEVGSCVTVQLVMAKARVAPAKKKVSIPRLELLGCGIGARLTSNHVVKYLEMEDKPVYYWTDSTTALTWIQHDKPWARFVANRVDAIRKITRKEDWRHVPGDMNPADVPSRGCTAEFLLKNRFWEGPDWLKMPMESWPNCKPPANEEDVNLELKKAVALCSDQVEEDMILQRLQRFSDYHKVLRVMAYVVRYMRSLRRRAAERKEGQLYQVQKGVLTPATAEEVENAETIVLRLIQSEAFEGITDKRILSMGAFIDDKGLIRVKTQLLFGEDSFNMKCPIVLPHNHPIVKVIIFKEHCIHSHAGTQILQAQLRERYWILKSRRAIGSVVTACPTCRRFIAKKCEVPSAPLPLDRIKNTVAFDITGVDLAGPLYLRDGGKAWIVLYTCAVYRAVHLEVVTTLSTPGFISSFRRFVARRGRPSKVYSDNGLNFVGCANLFKEVDWDAVQSYAAVSKISWVFNPPTAAWWGGFWERLIGVMKPLIRRILGKKSVDLEELQTLLCDVEATLNQRPLTYASDRKEELMPLCPIHFIKDNPHHNLPEADAVDAGALRKNLKLCQTLREALRVRFRKEYLGQLQHHAGQKERTVKVGDVVIVEDDNRKRLEWSLGVVVEVYPGRDGRIRKAWVKTKDGFFVRAVQRLFLMEVAEPEKKDEECPEGNEPSTSQPEVDIDKKEEKVSRFGRKLVCPQRLGL